MMSDHAIATLEQQRDRMAEVLAQCVVAAGIDTTGCSLKAGPDLVVLGLQLKELLTIKQSTEGTTA